MEGPLGIEESGAKKGIFTSLKSKKKFNAVLQASTITYTREGESTPAGTIVFSKDTLVEGDPKGKRVITVKTKKDEFALVCPDVTAYGKWMDAIAMVFRGFHVDPDAFCRTVSELTASTSSAAPTDDTVSSETDDASAEASDAKDSANGDKPTPPPRPVVPSVPDRPTKGNLTSPAPASDGLPPRSESKPDVAKPEVPKRPDKGPSQGNLKGSSSVALNRQTSATPPTSGSSTSPPPTLANSSKSNPNDSAEKGSESSDSKDSKPSVAPSPTAAKKTGVRTGSPLPSVPSIGKMPADSQNSDKDSISNNNAPNSARGPLSSRSPSNLQVGSGSSVSSPRNSTEKALPLSPRSSTGSTGSTTSTPPSTSSTTTTAVDPSKRIIVWMPNGNKHSSFWHGEATVRSYIEKICKSRENVTPETFVAKTADGTVIDLDTTLNKLGTSEIWWDTLAEGQTMPAAFAVAVATPKDSVAASPNKSASASPGSGVIPSGPAKTNKSAEPEGPPVDHRTKVVREILSTEQSYVDALTLLQTHFLQNLLTAVQVKSDAPKSTDQQMPTEAIVKSMIPKNFDSILGFNKILLGELTACSPDAIGALFSKYAQFLKVYNDYSSDYQASLATYNKAMRDFPAFSAKLDELRAASGSKLRLEDYIIMPVQRVPRYSLLVQDLIRHTPDSHSDFAKLTEVAKMLADIGTFINESVRKSDGSKRLKELEDKGVAVDRLITPSRFLVREGPVKVLEQKNKVTKHFFLFNDVLVQVKDSSMTKGVDLSLPEYVWPLNLVWIQETDELAEIVGPHGVSMTIKKKKADLTWLKDLNQRILAHIQKSDSSATSPGAKRNGIYLSPYEELYDGEWLSGLKHGFGKATIPGSVYEGTWQGGKRNGRGTMNYSGGIKYEGDWKNDNQHGQGTLFQSNTETYSGTFVNGTPNGHGTFTYLPSGDTYDGDIYEGRCTGQGSLTCANGVTYTGQWKDDQFDGRGKLTSPDSGTYEGQFRGGVKTGKGLMLYLDGSKYNGEWNDGFRHGKGELIEKDGTKYEGDWMDDRPEGKGTKWWPDGVRYEGQFSRGLRKGVGKCFYADGAKYEGNWLDDLPHNQGSYITTAGYAYTGEWVYGRREGKGACVFTTTARYEGQWFNDRFHKSGVYTASGSESIKSYDGEWSHGRMFNKGTLTFPNGDSFKGLFKDGRAHGAGTYTYATGATFTGKWNMSVREGKGAYMPSADDKNHTLSGTLEVNGNMISTGNITIFLPPQQPLFLTIPAIEALRLHH